MNARPTFRNPDKFQVLPFREWMRNNIPGVVIPDEIINRLRSVPDPKQCDECKRICIEIIQQVREIEGVSGVHVMAYRQEELVAQIIEEAGLLPRRFQPHYQPNLHPQEVID